MFPLVSGCTCKVWGQNTVWLSSSQFFFPSVGALQQCLQGRRRIRNIEINFDTVDKEWRGRCFALLINNWETQRGFVCPWTACSRVSVTGNGQFDWKVNKTEKTRTQKWDYLCVPELKNNTKVKFRGCIPLNKKYVVILHWNWFNNYILFKKRQPMFVFFVVVANS